MRDYKTFTKRLASSCFAAVSFSTLAQPGLETETIKEMETLKAQYSLPSLSVAIGQGEKVTFAKAIGLADVDMKKKANLNTQYSVGKDSAEI